MAGLMNIDMATAKEKALCTSKCRDAYAKSFELPSMKLRIRREALQI
jgi:hypothetical protein